MNDRLTSICPNLDPENRHIAIHEKERTISYGELGRGIENLTTNLLRTGLTQGCRIGLCFENTAAFVYGFMAILGAKCIPVLLSPSLPKEKIAYIIGDSGTVGMLTDARTFNRLASYPIRMRFAFLNSNLDSTPSHQIALYSFEEGIRSNEIEDRNPLRQNTEL